VPPPAGLFTPTPTCLGSLTTTSRDCACRIGRGQPLYCVCSHRSGADYHRRMQRHPLTDPKPEPKPPVPLPPKPAAKETRKQKRALLFPKTEETG
jgi:hypothetical protein